MRDDQGVSVVIGTILLAALVAAVLIMVKTTYVPLWQDDAQAAQTRTVSQEFAGLASVLEAQIGNRSGATEVTSLDLGQPASPLGLGGPPGTSRILELQSANGTARIDLNLFSPTLIPGLPSAAGANETWVGINGSSPVTQVGIIQSFRLRAVHPDTANTGDNLTVDTTDAAGAFVGRLIFYKDSHSGSDDFYKVKTCRTLACTGDDLLYDQGLQIHNSGHVSGPLFTNVLSPDYRLDKLLAGAAVPLTIRLTQVGLMVGDFAITYSTPNGTTGPQSGGSPGGPSSNVNLSWPGRTLVLRTFGGSLPAQDLVFEHGAVVVRQGNDSTFRVEPAMGVRTIPGVVNLTYVTLDLPALNGTPTAISGAGAVSLATSVGSQRTFDGTSSLVTLNLTTAFPQLWTAFWTARLGGGGSGSGAGLPQGADCGLAGAFTVCAGPTWARLSLAGLDPNATRQDIVVVVRQADVRLQLT